MISNDVTGGSSITSDAGWGCTLRCGQMLLAEAIVQKQLGKGWCCLVGNPVLRHFYRLEVVTQKRRPYLHGSNHFTYTERITVFVFHFDGKL